MHNLCSNFAGRYLRREQGYDSRRLDRHFVHSHFRKSVTMRAQGRVLFTCCDFIPYTSNVIVGLHNGEMKVYSTESGEEYITHLCHDSYVDYVKCSKDGRRFLTSSVRGRPFSEMWSIVRNQFSLNIFFEGKEHLEFSNLNENKILATSGVTATLYDIEYGRAIALYKSLLGNPANKNKATFSPADDLILSDGALWDVRSGEEVHRFELPYGTWPGLFHPKGFEIVSNDKVYDMRTHRLLKTVPELNESIVTFSPQNVIYGICSRAKQISHQISRFWSHNMDSNVGTIITGFNHKLCFGPMSNVFKTFDGYDYSSIDVVDVSGTIYDLSVNECGTQIALVENMTESLVRIYNVGMRKEEDHEDDTDDHHDN